MPEERIIAILEEIREGLNHWDEEDCHEKCHMTMDYITEILKVLQEK